MAGAAPAAPAITPHPGGADMRRAPSPWVLGCAVAESVGMTAAAAAARIGDQVVTAPHGAGGTAVLVGLAVAGGTVEALGLALATWVALRALLPGLPFRRWTAVTTVTAGLSWAVGSLPAALSSDTAD